jgi:hypothetical protein
MSEVLTAHVRVVDVAERSRVEGQGLGSQLVRTALSEARSDRLSVLPFCPFVRSYIAGHTAYLDLVPEATRATFELPADGCAPTGLIHAREAIDPRRTEIHV